MNIVREQLHEKTASALRDSIKEGIFTISLPSERVLSEQLGVSRPILRKALQLMHAEGELVLRGKRRYIVQKRRKDEKKDIKQVCFLCSMECNSQNNEIIHLQEIIAEKLGNTSIAFRISLSLAAFRQNPASVLEGLTESAPNSLWLLYRSTPALQAWFNDSPHRACVIGGLYPGVNLPFVNVDYAGICRHAAGILWSRGYRRILLFKQANELPGDETSTKSFLALWNKLSLGKSVCKIVEHDGTKASVIRKVDASLNAHGRECAWFVFDARACFTVLSRLSERGIALGNEISVMCRDNDPYFDLLTPSIAYYRRDTKRLAKKLTQMISLSAKGNKLVEEQILFEAEFVDNPTLGSVK